MTSSRLILYAVIGVVVFGLILAVIGFLCVKPEMTLQKHAQTSQEAPQRATDPWFDIVAVAARYDSVAVSNAVKLKIKP